MIEAGRYRAVAVSVEAEDGTEVWAQFGRSKIQGTEQVVVNFEILDGASVGSRIAWFGYFSDKTVDRTLEALRICGWKGNDLATAIKGPIDNEVSLVIEHETDPQGQVRPRVRWVNRPGGGGLKIDTMAPKDMATFAARLRLKAGTAKEVAGKKPDRAATPAPDPAPSKASQGEDWNGNDAPDSPDPDELCF